MINRNGDVLLNLENTVLVLKDLVERHYEIDRVIADLGIKVIGVELTQPPETLGLRGQAFGDAYPQKVGTLLEYWVWTRPDSGIEDPARGLWFNIGPLAIPGPQGIQGPAGPQGEPGHSTRWYIGGAPQEVANPVVGDLFLKTTDGTVYEYSSTGWGYAQISLRGPQGVPGTRGLDGPPGPQGERGPVGPQGEAAPSIRLIGILDSVDLLPEPSDQYAGLGYIVRSSTANVIYSVFINTEEPHDYIWQIAGTVSGFSIVTAGGEVVPQFNADTKLDKDTSTTTYNQVYVKAANGGQGTINVTKQVVNDAIPQRQSDGNIYVPATPVENTDAASKGYVDTALAGKLDKVTRTTNYPQVYQKSVDGTQSMRDQIHSVYSGDTWANHPYALAQRDEAGAVRGPNPTQASQYVTKSYAEANFTPKLYRHTIYASCYGYDYDGNSHSIEMMLEIISTQSTNISAGAIPEVSLINLIAGTSAPIAYIVANGICDGDAIGRVSFTRADNTITVYNQYDELVTAFQQENGVCRDNVLAIG